MAGGGLEGPRGQAAEESWGPHTGFRAPELLPALPFRLCFLPAPGREGQGPLEILQLDFEMENFTSQSVKRRILWHIDYRGHGALPDLERAVTELTVIQRDVQAILPLAMVSRAVVQPWVAMPIMGACVTGMCTLSVCRSMHVVSGGGGRAVEP